MSSIWPFVDLIFDLEYGNVFYGKWEAWPISNSNLWIESEIILSHNPHHQKQRVFEMTDGAYKTSNRAK